MNDWCGHCGHHRDVHLHSRRCQELVPAAGTAWTCPCERFVSIGALIGVRILAVFFWCAVLGSLLALVDAIAGGAR